MATVRRALEEIKCNPTKFLTSDLIFRACKQAEYKYRERVLGPVETISAMVRQTALGNAPIGEVVRLYQGMFTASAYCQACQRIPLEVFFGLFHEQHALMQSVLNKRTSSWHGHGVFVMDASGFSMPDMPALATYFGYPNNQDPEIGFPVGRVMLKVDPYTGLALDFVPSPLNTGEAAIMPLMLLSTKCKNIIIADSNFGTAPLLQVAQSQGVHMIAPIHVKRKVRFRGDPVKQPKPGARKAPFLKDADEIMEWEKASKRPVWMDERLHASLADTIKVRVIRCNIASEGSRKTQIVIVTTLLDKAKYPAAEIAELYKLRWRIETCFKTIKHTLNLDVLRSRTVGGIQKELLMIVLVYNIVRMIMLRAAKQQKVPPNRISFADALRWLRYARPTDEIPRLNVIPHRPDRNEPRERKRRAKAYPLMQTPRYKYHELRKNKANHAN